MERGGGEREVIVATSCQNTGEKPADWTSQKKKLE